ncbi:MAG: histidine phosphatase family protein [Rubrivivax sp.]|nr:histidine phosphatase family protein [Rubrivivax sp.]
MNLAPITRRLLTAALLATTLSAGAAHAQLTVYIVRHGQTDWNKEGRIQGGTDNPLNSTGREQAAAMGRLLADVKIDAVYTSSHQRARQTAAVLEGRAPVIAMDELRERFFGKFEGANDKDPAVVADWNQRRFTWADAMEGGESLENQARRAGAALQTLRERHKEGGTVVVVGHGGINPLLVSLLLGLPPQEGASAINQGNDEVYRIELARSGTASIWKLIPRSKLGEL